MPGAWIHDEDDELARLEPLERAHRAGELLEVHRARVGDLSITRGLALAEAVLAGRPAAEVAKELGLSRQRIYALIRDAEQKASERP